MKGVWKSNFKYLMNRDKWEDNCVKYEYGRMWFCRKKIIEGEWKKKQARAGKKCGKAASSNGITPEISKYGRMQWYNGCI